MYRTVFFALIKSSLSDSINDMKIRVVIKKGDDLVMDERLKLNDAQKKKMMVSFDDVANSQTKGISDFLNGFKDIHIKREEAIKDLTDRENKKLELMIEDNKRLDKLLENSNNAIEQRDAMIHNMYKMITESDASDKVKSNSILQIITLVNTLSDGKENLIKMLGLKDIL